MDANKLGYWIGALVGGFVVGLLCGLIPFFVGKKRGQLALGIGGLIACTISGLVLGILLALPFSLVFTIIIVFAKPKQQEPPPVRR